MLLGIEDRVDVGWLSSMQYESDTADRDKDGRQTYLVGSNLLLLIAGNTAEMGLPFPIPQLRPHRLT